jgi:hypothetical protein
MDCIEGLTNHGEDAFNSFRESAIDGATGGELVAAATELRSDRGNVDGAFGTEADPDAAFRELAKKGSSLDTDDAKGIVDDALAVFVPCADTGHIVVGDRDPGKGAVALEAGESCAEDEHL